MDFILTAVRGLNGVSLPFLFIFKPMLFLPVIRIHKFLGLPDPLVKGTDSPSTDQK